MKDAYWLGYEKESIKKVLSVSKQKIFTENPVCLRLQGSVNITWWLNNAIPQIKLFQYLTYNIHMETSIYNYIQICK